MQAYDKFRITLTEIKNDFKRQLEMECATMLTAQSAAVVLQKHLKLSPVCIREALTRSIGKNSISWDELLQYLSEELSLKQTVKKYQNTTLSIIELHEEPCNDIEELLRVVLRNNADTIHNFFILDSENILTLTFAILMQKQIIFYDFRGNNLLGYISFRYRQVAEKVTRNEMLRRIKKNDMRRARGCSDKVQPIQRTETPCMSKILNIFGGQVKSSVRGSEVSSEKSNERSLLRRTMTNNSENKRKIKNQVKLRSDEVSKLFTMFEEAKLENSIALAAAYTEAVHHKQKSFSIDKQFLQKEPKETHYDVSEYNFKDFTGELRQMRATNQKLTSDLRLRPSQSLDLKKNPRSKAFDIPSQIGGNQYRIYLKEKKEMLQKESVLQSKALQLVSVSVCSHYLLVSLFNCEVRLYSLKKSLNRIKEEFIFEKGYEQLPSFVLLYRSTTRKLFNMAVLLQGQALSTVSVYQLTVGMEINSQIFSCQIDYLPVCQSLLPLGFGCFSEVGNFSLIQLNSPLRKDCQSKTADKALCNLQTKMKIHLIAIKIYRDLTSIYMACHEGYLYIYDKHRGIIKTQRKIGHSAILDFDFTKCAEEVIVLLKSGNIVISYARNLELIFLLPSYRDMAEGAKLIIVSEERCLVVGERHISNFRIQNNKQKTFALQRPNKVLNSRTKMLMKNRVRPHKQGQKHRSRIHKFIDCSATDCFIFIAEHGQILVYDYALEYVGSYHYMNVANVVDGLCNDSFQFISLLFDNNDVAVMNIFTQAELFCIRWSDDRKGTDTTDKPLDLGSRWHDIGNKWHEISNRWHDESKLQRKQANESGFSRSHKGKHQQWRDNSILHMHFFQQTSQYAFFCIITNTFVVQHYLRRGELGFIIDLMAMYAGMLKSSTILYRNDELILANTFGDILVLQKKSYIRKFQMKICEQAVIKYRKISNSFCLPEMKKTENKDTKKYNLCCLTNIGNVFFANTTNRAKLQYYDSKSFLQREYSLFTESILLRQGPDTFDVKNIGSGNQYRISVKDKADIFVLAADKSIIMANRTTGLLLLHNQLGELQDEFMI